LALRMAAGTSVGTSFIAITPSGTAFSACLDPAAGPLTDRIT
jgi:hypothetical protein